MFASFVIRAVLLLSALMGTTTAGTTIRTPAGVQANNNATSQLDWGWKQLQIRGSDKRQADQLVRE
jgi:hypothetical protein